MSEQQIVSTVELEIIDNSKRAKLLKTVFWSLMVLAVIGLVPGYLEIQLLKRAQLGDFISESEVNTSDAIQGVIGMLQFVIYIVSVVVFLNWFRRAYGNLHRLKVPLDHKESMAVWTWFIPFIVLFRPVQIMNEIWSKTQAVIKKFNPFYAKTSGKLIIGAWWALFLISNFVGKYVLKTAFKQDTIEDLINGSQAILYSDLIQIPEALLVILIVSKVSRMETMLAEEIKKGGGRVLDKK
ncbi:DUF4328 domain-containing protein [Joostella sp. CR20]|uniref:DUF4328 domain-containing protein n=1 Tax=Joostella sp. CR20 TaxID=2804312 RepID=UPI00313A8CA9